MYKTYLLLLIVKCNQERYIEWLVRMRWHEWKKRSARCRLLPKGRTKPPHPLPVCMAILTLLLSLAPWFTFASPSSCSSPGLHLHLTGLLVCVHWPSPGLRSLALPLAHPLIHVFLLLASWFACTGPPLVRVCQPSLPPASWLLKPNSMTYTPISCSSSRSRRVKLLVVDAWFGAKLVCGLWVDWERFVDGCASGKYGRCWWVQTRADPLWPLLVLPSLVHTLRPSFVSIKYIVSINMITISLTFKPWIINLYITFD